MRSSSSLVLGLLASLAAIGLASACSHRVASGGPLRRWELRGAVVDATEDRLRIRHKTGQVVELVLDSRTSITRNEQPRGRDELRYGTRVLIEVEPLAGGGQRAARVRLYGGARSRDSS
jgi:hypothetical protein